MMFRITAAQLFGKEKNMGVLFNHETGDFRLVLDNKNDFKPFTCGLFKYLEIEKLVSYLQMAIDYEKQKIINDPDYNPY